jgi:hypothetical protein
MLKLYLSESGLSTRDILYDTHANNLNIHPRNIKLKQDIDKPVKHKWF